MLTEALALLYGETATYKVREKAFSICRDMPVDEIKATCRDFYERAPKKHRHKESKLYNMLLEIDSKFISKEHEVE